MAKKRIKESKAASPVVVPTAPTERKVITLPSSGDLPVYYVNNVNIDVSSWDVRFRLGQVQGMEGQNVTVKDVAIMFMSHAHMKAFATLMLHSVAKLDALPQPEFVNPNEQTH